MKTVRSCLTWLGLSLLAIMVLGIIVASQTPRDNTTALLDEPTHTLTPAPTFTEQAIAATAMPTLVAPLPLVETAPTAVELVPTPEHALIVTATSPPALRALEAPLPVLEPTPTLVELVPTRELAYAVKTGKRVR